METDRIPEEYTSPPEEFQLPEETYYTGEEYSYKAQSDTDNGPEKRHERLKKMLLIPVAASVSAVSILFSSIGFDPLGEDIFNSDEYSHHHAHEYDIEPWDIVHDYYRVTYLPTGDTFESESEGDAGYEEMCSWVEERGGVRDSIRVTGFDIVLLETMYSDDYIGVGDPDDPDDIYVAQGRQIKVYKRINICEASDKDQFGEYGDPEFPLLSNTESNGYAEGFGVLDEEYIIYNDGEEKYIVAGSALGRETSQVDGIRYDADTNSLILSGVVGGSLNVNLMGNGFRIVVEGDNRIDSLLVWGFHYGGSVTITGSGSLTINGDMIQECGIYLKAEESESCIMIDRGVRLDVYGSVTAVLVEDTKLEKSIYFLEPLYLDEGVRAYDEKDGLFSGYIADRTGAFAKHAVFR